MQETYFVQRAIRYLKNYMIPVPDEFPVHPDYLLGCEQADFIAGFKQLHTIVGQIYDDMYQDPARFGLPLYETEKYPQFSKERNTARHAVYRLGNLFYNLGRAGEISGGELAVDLERYKAVSKDKSVPSAPVILNQLANFGFELAGFNGKGFDKGARALCIAYPDNNHVMTALKAFSMTVSPEHHDNRHRIGKNFYIFHHRLLSTHTGKAPGSDIPDFLHVIGPANRAFFSAFHQRMVEKGFAAQYNKSYEWKLDYYKNKKYSYHYFQFEDDNFWLRLKLSNVRTYTDFLEGCPAAIQQVFINNPPCHRCQEVCPMRVEYEFGGAHHESCVCFTFQFEHPKVENIDTYFKLMELEDGVLAAKK